MWTNQSPQLRIPRGRRVAATCALCGLRDAVPPAAVERPFGGTINYAEMAGDDSDSDSEVKGGAS